MPDDSRAPLVSCVLATYGRTRWALNAIELFRRQDYPNLEFVVVEDGEPQLAALLPDDPRIRLESTGGRSSVGLLRNRACQSARGEIIVCWDDDDWYGADRVSRQVLPILEGRVDLTGLVDFTWLELDGWHAWRIPPEYQERLLFRRINCGTAAFRREVFEQAGGFPDMWRGSDFGFVTSALDAGARLELVDGSTCYVYVRHGRNTWQVECARSGGPHAWRRSDLPPMPDADLAFLRAQARSQRADFVSCILPASGRRPSIERAIAGFARQDHDAAELLILDDGPESLAELAERVPGVVYHRLERPMSTGAKRNIGAELARGDFLASWGEDDWQASDRLSTQLAALQAAKAEATGPTAMLYYAPATRRAWSHRWPSTRRPWLPSAAAMLTRSAWEHGGFAEDAAPDGPRTDWLAPHGRVTITRDPLTVGIVDHDRRLILGTGGARRVPIPPESVEAILGATLESQ